RPCRPAFVQWNVVHGRIAYAFLGRSPRPGHALRRRGLLCPGPDRERPGRAADHQSGVGGEPRGRRNALLASFWILWDHVTSIPGDEHFARFSPDGSQTAFSGEYDGNVDVYVISSDGGVPRRLTWHPSVDDVVGWSPDGKSVLFRSNRAIPQGGTQIWRVPAA